MQQCIDAQADANALNVHTVFWSPLRRALETAYHVFKAHSNFENIKFIVLPDMRESLGISWDIPVNIWEIEQEYKMLIPNIDFSLLDQIDDKLHYFLHNIEELVESTQRPFNIKSEVLSKLELKLSDPIGTNAYDSMIEIWKRSYPKCLETIWNVYDRAARVKSYVANYLSQSDINSDQQVILCSHYFFLYTIIKIELLYVYTGVWEKEYSREVDLPLPDIQLKLKNWEFMPDTNRYYE